MNFLASSQCEATKWQKAFMFKNIAAQNETQVHTPIKKYHNTLFISFIRQYPKWLFPGKTDIDPSQEHIQEKDVLRVLDSMNPFAWIKSAKIIIKHNPYLVIIPYPKFITMDSFI